MRTPLRQKLGPLARPEIVIPDRPSISDAKKQRIWERHEGKCWICREPVQMLGPTVQYDHMVARALTGRDDDDAFGPAHFECHAKKFARDLAAINKAKRLALKDAGEFPESKGNRKLKSKGFERRWTP